MPALSLIQGINNNNDAILLAFGLGRIASLLLLMP
jgi:hypothetical protein